MMRPLAGLKVIEFEGIGPGPLAGRMLADLGAEVVAVVRPEQGPARRSGPPALRGSSAARKADCPPQSEASRSGRGSADADRDGRRADRGQSARRDGASWARPRGMRQAQSATRLRAHDRLGAGRSARAGRGPRPQLSCAQRNLVARRSRRSAAGRPADGSRRRRRRARPRLRRGRRRLRRRAQRQGLRDRLFDRRYRREPRRHRACRPRRRNARRAEPEPVPRLAILRRLRLRRRTVCHPLARSSRNSTRCCSTSSVLRTSTRRRNTTAPLGRR